MLTYVLVAFGLSMDAFAVSVSSGICVSELRFRHAFRAALFFGFFQFAMPIIGFLAGTSFRSYIEHFDHWVAFGLLAFIGGKMLLESLGAKDESSCSEEELRKHNILDLGTLFLLALATSIDALAVGISYSLIQAPVLLASSIIGIVTLGLCLVGMEAGKRLGSAFERYAEIAGGLVLSGIGIKILAEHLAK